MESLLNFVVAHKIIVLILFIPVLPSFLMLLNFVFYGIYHARLS